MSTDGRNVLDPACDSRRVLDLLADTATVLVIHALGDQRLRYGQLEQRVGGIPQGRLTGTLRTLMRHRLVETVPDGDGYKLTALGGSLLEEVLEPLCTWAETHVDDVRPPAPRAFAGGGCAPPTS
jgi:DNA-binding HxlR family transcriptional regulator